MEIIQFFIELLSDPRKFIIEWINNLGPIWVYAPLFTIIFVETGLVVMPFLPGDSLLFAAGFFASDGAGLSIGVLISLLSAAAILGNTSNYWIGRKIGQAILDSGRVKPLTPERVAKTQAMLDKYGLLAIVLTRFFPFLRTFAPFIAGVGNMHFARFTLFNAIGGVLWVSIFTLLGYYFGGIPVVQENFELVIVAILVISLLPTIIGLMRVRINSVRAKKQSAEELSSQPESNEQEKADSQQESNEQKKSDAPQELDKSAEQAEQDTQENKE